MKVEAFHIDDHEEQVKDIIMLAARILLEAGAEGTRTEETMSYIASHYGFTENNSFVTNTVINFMLHDESYPRIYRIKERNTNLIKISKVNSVSRKLVRDELTLKEAFNLLEQIYIKTKDHPIWFKTIAGALIALSFLYLQDGLKIDIFTAFLAGALGICVTEIIKKKDGEAVHTGIFWRSDNRLNRRYGPHLYSGRRLVNIADIIGDADCSGSADYECNPGSLRRSYDDVYDESIRSAGYFICNRSRRFVCSNIRLRRNNDGMNIKLSV